MAVAALLLAVVTRTGVARAQDRFEIQVYSSGLATPLRPGIEMHANSTWLSPDADPSQVDLSIQAPFRLTFEPHLGLTRWAETGMYLQTALLDDGRYDYSGVKLRLKLGLPEGLFGGALGLALNQEISIMPTRYGQSRYGWELRPIVDYRYGRLYVAFNPMVGMELEGPQAGRPDFSPAGRVMVSASSWLSLGVEYYGGWGYFDQLLPSTGQTHWLLAAVELEVTRGPLDLELNLAFGRGLAGPEDWVLKAIAEIDFNQ